MKTEIDYRLDTGFTKNGSNIDPQIAYNLWQYHSNNYWSELAEAKMDQLINSKTKFKKRRPEEDFKELFECYKYGLGSESDFIAELESKYPDLTK